MGPAVLIALVLLGPAQKHRVSIDPGHGYPGNEGTTNVFCEKEQDITLSLSRELARRLEESGRFEVQLSRTTTVGAPYRARLEAARKFRAEVLLSIHIDARMLSEAVEVRPGCFRNDEERGFSVLFSARGEKSLVEKRRKLSRAIAAEFTARKFIAYGGRDYLRNYTADEQPGVFIDGRRLFMLEKPTIPSLIIETHQSLAATEVELWRKPETRAAFADVVIAALDQYFK